VLQLVQRLEQTSGPGQTRLTLGAFTLYPAFGSVQPNGHQTVTVDYLAESQGISEEVQ